MTLMIRIDDIKIINCLNNMRNEMMENIKNREGVKAKIPWHIILRKLLVETGRLEE